MTMSFAVKDGVPEHEVAIVDAGDGAGAHNPRGYGKGGRQPVCVGRHGHAAFQKLLGLLHGRTLYGPVMTFFPFGSSVVYTPQTKALLPPTVD